MDDAPDDARAVLEQTRALRARSRRLAHLGAWLPAGVLGLLPLLSIALYRHPLSAGPSDPVDYPYWAGLPDPQRHATGSYVFWLVALPLAFASIGAWYRHRERQLGLRVDWRAPVTAGGLALILLVALFAAPSGQQAAVGAGTTAAWTGLLTPLVPVGVAAVVLGLAERSTAIVLSGGWLLVVAWQCCATGLIGGLLGWQTWILDGGSGPALGGQLTLLGLDRPAPALLAISLPLLLSAAARAARGHRP